VPEAKVPLLSALSGFKLPQTLSANEEEEISCEMLGLIWESYAVIKKVQSANGKIG